MWLLAILACANNIREQYQAEKELALAAPPALGAHWDPELRIRLSDDALGTLASAALSTGLLSAEKKITWEGPLGVDAELTPKVQVKGLTLTSSKVCDACLDLVADLEGTGPWKLGKLKGEVPLSLELDGTVSFDVRKQGGAFLVSGRVKDIRHVKVKSTTVGDLDIARPIEGWGEALASRTPPFDLGEFGGDGVPLRALRLTNVGGALAVEAVTDVGGGGPLSGKAAKLEQGWELAISQATALALMRREAFNTGVIAYDVAADPRSLELNGTVFTMGVRLWRLTSRGWWRDYEVTGQIEVLPETVRLVPKVVKEGDKSRGAGVADPLALLAEGKILDVVEDGLRQTLPSGESTGIGDQQLQLKAASVRGMGGSMVVGGALTIGAPSPETTPSGGGEGKQGRRRQQRHPSAQD